MTEAIAACVNIALVLLLFAVAFIDLRTQIIPNISIIIIAGLWVFKTVLLLIACLVGAAMLPDVLMQAGQGLLAAALSLAIITVVAVLYEQLTSRPSIGGGDIKFISVCALYLGPSATLLCLIVACIAFVITGVLLQRFGSVRFGLAMEAKPDHSGDVFSFTKTMIPFGPAIALGAAVALFFHAAGVV